MLDWTDAAAYAYVQSLNFHGKAWEYLRRNPQYVAAWSEYCQLISALECKYGDQKLWGSSALWNIPELFSYSPPLKTGEKYPVWLLRCLQSNIALERCPHTVADARKWGLTRMHDPAHAATGEQRFRARVTVPSSDLACEVEADDVTQDDGAFVYARFDLRLDVSPQTKALQRDLLARQRALRRHGSALQRSPDTNGKKGHERNIILHLRVLDASAAGEQRKHIAAVLFPTKKKSFQQDPDDAAGKKLDEQRRQAERYRDGDYLLLV